MGVPLAKSIRCVDSCFTPSSRRLIPKETLSVFIHQNPTGAATLCGLWTRLTQKPATWWRSLCGCSPVWRRPSPPGSRGSAASCWCRLLWSVWWRTPSPQRGSSGFRPEDRLPADNLESEGEYKNVSIFQHKHSTFTLFCLFFFLQLLTTQIDELFMVRSLFPQ